MSESNTIESLFDSAMARARERGEPDWLLRQRQAAFSSFTQEGLPTTRNEMWKYTNVKPLATDSFALPEEGMEIAESDVPPPRDDETLIVFVNGALSEARSQFGEHDGVTIKPLFEALGNGGAAQLQPLMQRSPSVESGVFGDLHSAFLSNGVVINVAAHANVTRRIHILCVQTRVSPGVLSAPRVVINAETSSRAMVVQSHVGVPDAAGFTNAAVDIHVAENAELSYCKVQSEGLGMYHVSQIHAEQERDSRLRLFDFSMGGRLVRNNVYVRLNGENGEASINGVYAVRGRQHVDNHLAVDHAAPHCNSTQTYKGILDEKSRAVFDGRIIVQPGSMLTDAIQFNQNILLSRDARVDTKPQLEISNDDVKCTHGATIGQLDEREIFYLQSRGIPRDESIAMLSRGFLEDVIYKIDDTILRDSLRSVLATYFEREESGA